LGLLQQLAANAFLDKQDIITAVLWAYFHSPPCSEGGVIAGMDVLKAFRALR